MHLLKLIKFYGQYHRAYEILEDIEFIDSVLLETPL